MSKFVTVDSLMGVNYEISKYEDKVADECDNDDNKKARLFSINQIRDLFYYNLHRCSLKQIVERDHELRMDDLKSYIQKVEALNEPTKQLIYKEKQNVIDMIEADRHDESQFRVRFNIELNDVTSKL